MTNQVTRYNLRPCPDCNDTGNYEMGNARIADTCKTCEGLRYIPAPAPEDKPAGAAILDEPLTASDHRFAALIAENEAYGRKLAAMETELAAARAEIERMRAGIINLSERADMRFGYQSMNPDAPTVHIFRGLRDDLRALLDGDE